MSSPVPTKSQQADVAQPDDDSGDGFMSHVFNHLRFAAVGLATGLLSALALVKFGPQYLQASPLYTVVAISLVFTLVGGMLAGFLALRPERYLQTLDARRHGADRA